MYFYSAVNWRTCGCPKNMVYFLLSGLSCLVLVTLGQRMGQFICFQSWVQVNYRKKRSASNCLGSWKKIIILIKISFFLRWLVVYRILQCVFISLLTIQRLQHLSMPILIDRLVLRKLFYYAVKICQYLKIADAEGASRILAHWACYKVQRHF